MDNKDNENIYVRPPDKVIKEKLIDDGEDDEYDEYDSWFKTNTNTNNNVDITKPLPLIRDTNDIWKNENENEYDYEYDLDYDLEKAIEESMKDFKEGDFVDDFIKECIKDEEEEEEETIVKNEILPLFKSNILRLIPFDKQLKELWEKISPIIDLYQDNKIDHHLLDEITYNNIFTILKSIRIPKDEWGILETIFIKQIK